MGLNAAVKLALKAIKELFSITVRLVPSELLQVLSDLDDFKAWLKLAAESVFLAFFGEAQRKII